MRIRLLAILCAMAAPSWADVYFSVPHGTTSYYSPCFPLYSTASDGAETLTGMSGSDGDFIIYAQLDNSGTDIEYQTTADIETISAIGTYVAPTADTDIRFGECGTPGTYQIQPRDTLLATEGAKAITFKFTDGGDTMADQIVHLDLNVAELTDLSDLIDARLAAYTVAQVQDVEDAESSIQDTLGDLEIEISADGSTFDSIPWNSDWDAEVQSEVADALAAYDPPTYTEMDAAFSAIDGKIDIIDANVDDLEKGIIYCTAETGTLTTSVATTDLTGYGNDQLIGRVIIWLDGDAAGEASAITDYASTNGTVTFEALTTAPGDGDSCKII